MRQERISSRQRRHDLNALNSRRRLPVPQTVEVRFRAGLSLGTAIERTIFAATFSRMRPVTGSSAARVAIQGMPSRVGEQAQSRANFSECGGPFPP